MPGPTTEVFNEEIREIRDGFLKLSVGLAVVRAEVRVFSRIVGVVGTLTISGLVYGIWWAATLDTRVSGVEARIGEINTRFDKIEVRFDKIDARIDRNEGEMKARFDKIDARIDRNEGEMKARFDRLEAAIKALAKP